MSGGIGELIQRKGRSLLTLEIRMLLGECSVSLKDWFCETICEESSIWISSSSK
jgi:hypothetical protein